MDAQKIIQLHPLVLCYKCVTSIDPSNFQEDHAEHTLTCPNCDSTLRTQELGIFTSFHDGLESEFKKWIDIDSSNRQEVINRFGSHYKIPHGWEPFFEFLLAAAAAGVIGGLSYDSVKKLAKRLFEKEYSRKITLNLDNHIKVVIEFIDHEEIGENSPELINIIERYVDQKSHTYGRGLTEEDMDATKRLVNHLRDNFDSDTDIIQVNTESDKNNTGEGRGVD